jgi:hypothetical protein
MASVLTPPTCENSLRIVALFPLYLHNKESQVSIAYSNSNFLFPREPCTYLAIHQEPSDFKLKQLDSSK